MGDVVSMKAFRKRKVREARETRAQRNRTLFGRSGQDKKSTRDERERLADEFEGKRLEKPDE